MQELVLRINATFMNFVSIDYVEGAPASATAIYGGQRALRRAAAPVLAVPVCSFPGT